MKPARVAFFFLLVLLSGCVQPAKPLRGAGANADSIKALPPFMKSAEAVGIQAPQTVVFLGDSITAFWKKYVDFPERQWIDAGVPGEKCSDLLARFQTDVIDRYPLTVHIMCGSNDLHTGVSVATAESSITQMIQKAQAAHIRVVLGTIPYMRIGGVCSPGLSAEIDELNQWIKGTGLKIADYHPILTDSDHQMNMQYSDDGVHPNAEGYAAMTPIAEAALSPPQE